MKLCQNKDKNVAYSKYQKKFIYKNILGNLNVSIPLNYKCRNIKYYLFKCIKK